MARSTSASPRTLLTLASAGVLLTAADTYVVVLALTDMMAGVGLGIESLAQATPIVSGFLLGYVAVLPLIGRLSDLLDRRRILLGCLLVFVVGSVVTALAVELWVLVGGRLLQGVGGGGLVPATLALVADLWPPSRRGVPLGVVGAVQELGAVVGPVLGAAVLAVTDWRGIFWAGALVGLLLYAALRLVPVGSGGSAASVASTRCGDRPERPSGVGDGPMNEPSSGPYPHPALPEGSAVGYGPENRPFSGPYPHPALPEGSAVGYGPENRPFSGPYPHPALPEGSAVGYGPEIPSGVGDGPMRPSGVGDGPENRPSSGPYPHPARRLHVAGRPRRHLVGPILGALAAATGWLALAAPEALVTHLTIGLAYLPLGGSGSRLATPIGLVALALGGALAAYLLWRGREVLGRADLPGALLVALGLGSVILTFAGADPEREIVGPLGLALLPLAVVAAALGWWRAGRIAHPLVPLRILRGPTGRAGLVSVCVGAALVAVVVDVPLLARLTVTDSQTEAAFVLLRFLVALPMGALAGGWLLRYAAPRLLTVAGLVLTAAGLAGMSRWTAGALERADSTFVLVLVGLAVGLTLAPVNAAALGPVGPDEHGVASSLVVVARMMGMVVGLAVLTAVGLHRYYEAVAALPDQGDGRALLALAVVQVQTVFLGAAVAAVLGAVVALTLDGPTDR